MSEKIKANIYCDLNNQRYDLWKIELSAGSHTISIKERSTNLRFLSKVELTEELNGKKLYDKIITEDEKFGILKFLLKQKDVDITYYGDKDEVISKQTFLMGYGYPNDRHSGVSLKHENLFELLFNIRSPRVYVNGIIPKDAFEVARKNLLEPEKTIINSNHCIPCSTGNLFKKINI